MGHTRMIPMFTTKAITGTANGVVHTVLLGSFSLNLSTFYEKLLLRRFVLLQVPKTAPVTRKQYNQCKQLWPTSFHEDKQWVHKQKISTSVRFPVLTMHSALYFSPFQIGEKDCW